MWDALLNMVVREVLTEEVMLPQRPTGEAAVSPGDSVSGERDPGSGNKVSPSTKALKLEHAWCVPETGRTPSAWQELREQGAEWEVSWERRNGHDYLVDMRSPLG